MSESGAAGPSRTYRFGGFELDVGAYQLRRDGEPVRVERLPMDLLILLVERRGQLVTRADIIDRLWGKDVFVDVQTAVHTAVRKIRQALHDSPDNPAFIETIPAKGYRFIGQVEAGIEDAVEVGAVVPEAAAIASSVTPPAPAAAGRRTPSIRRWRVAFGVLAVAVAAVFAGWLAIRDNGAASDVRLAVLPFGNLTNDPRREYVADGLAEEIIAALGQISPERIRVVGRTSTLSYKGTTKSLAQIGQELGVAYLVEGSVRAEHDQLRITAKLIRASDQEQVWSESYDHQLSSILALQRELSSAIAGQVALRLAPERLNALASRQTPDAEAYDLYLRGLSISGRRTPDSNQAAIGYYRRAIDRDPRYALAWAAMADIYAAMPINADVPALTAGPQARAAANQALKLEPEIAETQFVRGYVSWLLDWDWLAAEASFRRAIAINPGVSGAHRMLGHLYSQMRRHDAARAAMRRAVELDPLNPLNHAISAQVAFQARDYPAAVEHATRAVTLDPEFWIGYVQQAQAFEQLASMDRALDAVMKGARYSGGNSKAHALRAFFLARTGRSEEAREVLRALEATARERFVPPYVFALVHAGLGDRDAAFESLSKAYDVRDVHLVFLTVDPKWDPYRSDGRFAALIARCGFHVEGSIPP
jgi:TolB-like protein/DNA-binding winged helix-turn-helix (wHTH) protein/Flp pilus assembly protein TadD